MSLFAWKRGTTHFKTPQGDRVRAKQTAKGKAAKALSVLYAVVYKRDKYQCVACGKPVVVGSPDELKRAHPHHIIPRSLAAKAIKHTTMNVCTVCPFCHGDINDRNLFVSGNADKKLKIRRVKAA